MYILKSFLIFFGAVFILLSIDNVLIDDGLAFERGSQSGIEELDKPIGRVLDCILYMINPGLRLNE